MSHYSLELTRSKITNLAGKTEEVLLLLLNENQELRNVIRQLFSPFVSAEVFKTCMTTITTDFSDIILHEKVKCPFV